VAVEEVFVNIAHYAYTNGIGKVLVSAGLLKDQSSVRIIFTDSGIPYDPTKKEDPDVTLSAEEREIGGLGIYMTRKLMDDIAYERKNGRNILTLRKALQE
jgi:anti-sigma regulatory factor (Ser/Thr protein kinase)